MAEDIKIPDNLIMYSREMSEYGKSVIDPSLSATAATEWFHPGWSETPGFQEGGTGEQPIPSDPSLIGGGGAFVESMTTNFEENRACILNSFAIANVLLHCDKLKNHPKIPLPIRVGGCAAIMLWITYELYACYNKKQFGSGWKTNANRMPFAGVPRRGSVGFDSIGRPFKLRMMGKLAAFECKIEVMKKYGIEEKMKLFGYTPGPWLPAPDPDAPPMPPTVVVPPATVRWYTTGGTNRTPPTGGYPRVRPPSNPATASSCCPPIGCVVRVNYIIYLDTSPSRGGHSVAGIITKCDPLTISLLEHPLQTMAGGTMIIAPYINLDGSVSNAMEATISPPPIPPTAGPGGMLGTFTFIVSDVVCFC